MDVLLRSDSITGSIIGTSDSVTMPDGYADYTDFFFSTPITVKPGMTYYFQPVVEFGDSWEIVYGYFQYPGGTAFANGTANSFYDLWFREGVVAVPEPSSVVLLVLGGGALALFRRARAKPKTS